MPVHDGDAVVVVEEVVDVRKSVFSGPLVPRMRPTLMPSMMKRKVSSMLLMRGMDTRRCDARGGRLGIVSK